MRFSEYRFTDSEFKYNKEAKVDLLNVIKILLKLHLFFILNNIKNRAVVLLKNIFFQ